MIQPLGRMLPETSISPHLLRRTVSITFYLSRPYPLVAKFLAWVATVLALRKAAGEFMEAKQRMYLTQLVGSAQARFSKRSHSLMKLKLYFLVILPSEWVANARFKSVALEPVLAVARSNSAKTSFELVEYCHWFVIPSPRLYSYI